MPRVALVRPHALLPAFMSVYAFLDGIFPFFKIDIVMARTFF